MIKEIGERSVYIYGAKVAAIKTYKLLVEWNANAIGFLVSETYDNPDISCRLQVIRIEHEKDDAFQCVIVAMGTKMVWQMGKNLHNNKFKN